ncbi:MAG: indolepyruvate ferredoxin oxidoreductase, partial [Gammaproteobacteria bacterium]|nr:indolepyruvate ferredoxin oxidoreductase [Gammaproteobacteria bacterium]
EIFEAGEKYIEKTNDGRVAEWAANEKVAYEFALGTSYAGYRTVVTMKHVGLNVAFDAFVNSAITGVQGALVVAVADDPSMHSSQNEQDTRVLADFAHLPLLEPSTPQEVYDFTLRAFELSERLKLPVIIRLVTRLAHSRGEVFTSKERLSPKSIGIPSDDEKNNWVLIPAIARSRYRDLRQKLPQIIKVASEYNSISLKGKSKPGVLLAG